MVLHRLSLQLLHTKSAERLVLRMFGSADGIRSEHDCPKAANVSKICSFALSESTVLQAVYEQVSVAQLAVVTALAYLRSAF